MKKAKGKKPWYTSKTKIGALLVGISGAVGVIGAYLQGKVTLANAIQSGMVDVGAILGIFGLRDWPVLNR